MTPDYQNFSFYYSEHIYNSLIYIIVNQSLIGTDPGKSELYIFIWFRYVFDLFLIRVSI